MYLKNLCEKSSKGKIAKCKEYILTFDKVEKDVKYQYVLIDTEIILLPCLINNKRHKLFHNTMCYNRDVSCSGELIINKRTCIIDNFSGHYRPPEINLLLCIEIFKKLYPQYTYKAEVFTGDYKGQVK